MEFAREVASHRPYLLSVARRMVGQLGDAEDVVQDALLKATRAQSDFRAESSLKTWLTSVTLRTAIDHLRAKKRWDPSVMVDACDPAAGPGVRAKFDADASVRFDVKEHISLCFTCVGRSLDPEEQGALVASEVLGLTDREGADALGTTEPKFRHWLSAARATMKERYDGLCALVGKGGACHQCRVLRELAPEARRGGEPPTNLDWSTRVATAHAQAASPSSLNGYFFQTLEALQGRRQGG
ncbi:MAG: RNA polymerase sigma factor [Myxococcaceae bacterium]